MSDFFVLLDEPRRPWLDTDALKTKFHSLSQTVHPDRVHQASPAEREAANQRYTAFNAAYQVLRQPKERLAHLLELETGARPKDIQAMSSELTELFFAVGASLKEADQLINQKEAASSPIVKVQFLGKGMELADKLQALQARVAELVTALETRLHALNSAWETAPAIGSAARVAALPLAELEGIYRLLGYYTRWQQQLGERVFRLTV